jgi:hypothetical protein
MELGTFCRLLYPGKVTVGSQQHAAHTLDQWTLKPYTDQGTCQDGMVYMFWVTLEDNFQILIAFYFYMRI